MKAIKAEKAEPAVFTRIHALPYRRLRIDAARRSMTAGKFLNSLLEHSAAYRAALAAYDENPPRKK